MRRGGKPVKPKGGAKRPVARRLRKNGSDLERQLETPLRRIRLKVDALVTNNTPGALLAKPVTTTIPSNLAAIADPLGCK